MRIADRRVVHSPSDLNNYLECRHLSWLDLLHARGEIPLETEKDSLAERLAQRGEAHEAERLEEFRRTRASLVEIERGSVAESARRTRAAMAAGVAAIYQACFARPDFLAYADFLLRVERPSALGPYGYEVADAKLARSVRPYFLIQLCAYSEALAELQGAEPEHMHVLLGDGRRVSFRTAEYVAYFRALRERFRLDLEGASEPVYPFPVENCGVCRWRPRCEARRQADDHLVQVANIRREQILKLEAAGVTTRTQLAGTPPETRVPRLAQASLQTLRAQAALQVAHERSGTPSYELLPPEAGRGFALLPAPHPADLFFDLEGDPLVGDGLEYLWGFVELAGGEPHFRGSWAHDEAGQQARFEEFVDFVLQRKRAHPEMHVYHYATYEPATLKRLAGRYGSREDDLDELLTAETFVDLYRIVRQALRVSTVDYSLKSLEIFYFEGVRGGEVKSAGDSILAYETYLDTGDAQLLEEIRQYNELDCVSLWRLRRWLDVRAQEAEERWGVLEVEPAQERERSERAADEEREVSSRRQSLLDGIPSEPTERDDEQQARWLVAQLLEYHRRERRPFWWAFFQRQQETSEDLLDDAECVAELTPDPERPPFPEKRSLVYPLRFPPQELKLSPGTGVADCATGASTGNVTEIDARRGILYLKRGARLQERPLPRAVMPSNTFDPGPQRRAVRRLADTLLAIGVAGAGRHAAARGVLLRQHPTVLHVPRGASLLEEAVEEENAWRVLSGLNESHLFLQGPPGSGKTYLGARLLVRLLEAGKRVGVTATSHVAIHNLLDEVEAVAHQRGVRFRGFKKSDEANRYVSRHGFIECSDAKEAPLDTHYRLVAGTAWLFARPELDQALDYLFCDEAGQVSLADALAVGLSARNLVYLGDPQQLPHVTQGTHPPGAGASVLEHLLGENQTVPPERGLFLERSWRMHPEICSFVSEISYEGRLHPADGCERQTLEGHPFGAAGLRFAPVPHAGNGQRSLEEAERVRALYDGFLDANYVARDGQGRRLGPDDILVVTPYNAQVRVLSDALPEGARIGTVDKFQGREAPVVLFSMASSSADDVPRGLEFLFNRSRLNVAISRAQCLVTVVASPALLAARCRSADQLRLVNALCRFVETARAV